MSRFNDGKRPSNEMVLPSAQQEGSSVSPFVVQFWLQMLRPRSWVVARLRVDFVAVLSSKVSALCGEITGLI